MIETVITTGIGAIIGASVGGAITAKVAAAVAKVQIAELTKKVETHIISAVTRPELESLNYKVGSHAEALGRVIYRDSCDSCKGNKDERHMEVVRRLTGLEEAFRSCFDDLVASLTREHAK